MTHTSDDSESQESEETYRSRSVESVVSASSDEIAPEKRRYCSRSVVSVVSASSDEIAPEKRRYCSRSVESVVSASSDEIAPEKRRYCSRSVESVVSASSDEIAPEKRRYCSRSVVSESSASSDEIPPKKRRGCRRRRRSVASVSSASSDEVPPKERLGGSESAVSVSSAASDQIPPKKRPCSRCGRSSCCYTRNRFQYTAKPKLVQEPMNNRKSVTALENIKDETKSPPTTKDQDCQEGSGCPILSPLYVGGNEDAFREGDQSDKFEITLDMIMEAMKHFTKMHAAVCTEELAAHIAEKNNKTINLNNARKDFLADLEHKLNIAAEVGAIVKMKPGVWLMSTDRLSVVEHQTQVSEFRRIYLEEELRPVPREFKPDEDGDPCAESDFKGPAALTPDRGNPYEDEDII